MYLQINGIENKTDDVFEMQFANEHLKLVSDKELGYECRIQPHCHPRLNDCVCALGTIHSTFPF